MDYEDWPRPRGWRVFLGFLMAPWPSAVLCVLLSVAPAALRAPLSHADIKDFVRAVLPFAIVGGYLPGLVFGLPIYFLLRDRVRPRLIWIALCAALIAALPWAVIGLIQDGSQWDDDGPLRVDGLLTQHGVVVYGGYLAAIAGLGALGGFTFWLMAICGDSRLFDPEYA